MSNLIAEQTTHTETNGERAHHLRSDSPIPGDIATLLNRLANEVRALCLNDLKQASLSQAPRAMNREEAANALGVSPNTLSAWIEQNVLREGRHYRKVHNRYRFHPDLVERFFDDALSSEPKERDETPPEIQEKKKPRSTQTEARRWQTFNLDY